MNIMKWDDSYLTNVNKTEYALSPITSKNWDKVLFREKKNPMNHWVFPVITGHKYRVSWAATGLDFETFNFALSEEWVETDKNVMFTYNHTDVRAEINVTVAGQ